MNPFPLKKISIPLVGKTFEGWESLTDKKGTPQSILEKLPLSDATKQLQWELEHKLSDGIFARVRNVVGFHYSKTLIKIDHLKGTITDIDSHLFSTLKEQWDLRYPDSPRWHCLKRFCAWCPLQRIVSKQ
jgi:hypothetical protein